MDEPEGIAAGNPPFAPHAGLKVREAVADVALWTLRSCSIGVVLDPDDPATAEMLAAGAGTPAVDEAPLRALMLELVDAEADPRDGDEPLHLVVRFDVDELAELVGEIAASLTRESRRGLGMALLEVSQ